MNWKLIFGLSTFGLAMAFATVYVIPSKAEPFVWLPIFIVCAWLIAKKAPGKYFLHGLLVSLVNCVWITATHIGLSASYISTHPQEADMYAKMFAETGLSMHRTMLIMGAVIGVISGIVLGLFAYAASKIMNAIR